MYFSNQVTLYFSQAGQLGISQSRHLNQFSDSFTLIILCLFSVTYPLDVVRRRMQMKGISGDLFAYTSTKHAFTTIVQVEGVKGLYKGMWPNLLKVTLESHHHEILNSKRGGGLLLGILGSGLLLSLVLQLKSSQLINFTHKLLTKL